MDQSKHQNKRSLSQLMMNSQFLRRLITKVVVSVSVFSLIISHYSTWFSLLYNFNFYSSLPIKLISHSLDKNYTFLLCNGLLVFLAKYSGFFSSPSSSSSSSSSSSKYVNNNTLIDQYQYYSYKSFQDHQEPILLEKEDESHDQTSTTQNEHKHTEEVTIDVDVHHHEKESMHVEEHNIQGENQENEEEEEEEEEEVNEKSWMFWEEIEEKEEEEEEEKGGNGKLSTEELNKKFDEFIRKMKEELRIEAQRQLVMV